MLRRRKSSCSSCSSSCSSCCSSRTIKHTSIDIELPAGLGGGVVAQLRAVATAAPAVAAAPVEEHTETVLREMTRKHYKINKVVLGDETKIEGDTLYVCKSAATEGAEAASSTVPRELSLHTR